MIQLLDIGFRSGSIAMLGLVALLIFRQSQGRTPALLAIAFTMSLSAYLVCSAPIWNNQSRFLQSLLLLGCLANPVIFWLLARSIFEDGFLLSWKQALLLVAVEALGYWYVFGLHTLDLGSASPPPVAKAAGGLLQAISIALVIAALITAYRGRASDLVESRRNFRTRFVTIVGGYMVLVIMIEVFLHGTTPHPIASVFHAAAILAIVFYVSVALLTPKTDLLFEPLRTTTPVQELEAPERILLGRLDAAIANQAFRQDNLNIRQFASQLGSHEHQLRRLINAKMGFRNFNDFLNYHRVQVASQHLADPALASTPVLTIAMKLGYGSIGPFNRAFKLSTGLTPTEFRRQKLATLDRLTNSPTKSE